MNRSSINVYKYLHFSVMAGGEKMYGGKSWHYLKEDILTLVPENGVHMIS